MDWQLGLFRLGMLMCIVGAILIATQFQITDSIVAIWNWNPTLQETAAANSAASLKQQACLAERAGKVTSEFNGICPNDAPSSHGLARDLAFANIRAFLSASMALVAILATVVWLGVRMARESDLRHESRNPSA
ncbi:MAG TPA: hypothetical protein VNB30_03695 [Rhizomicrobium sp.]|jgi:hypothetical protein|nr:hypothetical protein [Rhizomicrobium sp.]